MYLPHYICNRKSPDKAAVEVNDLNKLNSFGMFYVGFIARPPKMGVEPCPYFDWWMLRDVPYTPLTSLTRTIPPQTLNGGNYRPKDRRSGTALTHSSVASAVAQSYASRVGVKTRARQRGCGDDSEKYLNIKQLCIFALLKMPFFSRNVLVLYLSISILNYIILS